MHSEKNAIRNSCLILKFFNLMFTNFSFLVLVCVCAIASAVAGYCLASLRMMRNARVSQPVATEVASAQVVPVAPAPTPKSAPVINNPASPTTPTETPKTSPKKSTSPKGGVASFTSSDLPTKPCRKDFADAKAYKAAYDAWWRVCKRLTSGKPVQPKVESKESQIVTPKPVVVNNKPESSKPVSPKGNAEKPAKTSAASEFTHTEGMPAKPNRADYVDGASYKKAYDAWWRQCKKAAKGVTNVTPKAETTQPKAETKPEPVATETKPEPKKATKKTTEPKAEVVETTKPETTEAPKAEVKESAPKDEVKDVQPVSDNFRYAQNTAESIVRVMNNKNIKAVTFTDAIATVFTEPKTKKEVNVAILGLRRTTKAEIYVCFETENKKLGKFELIKGAYVFNHETLKTILKQVNEGAAKKKNANATIERFDSAAA